MIKKQTKAQIAAEAARRVRLWDALHWTDDTDIAPDVPPPTGAALTTGWTFNAYAHRVDVACSSISAHAVGRTDKVTAQHPKALYSTRERAVRALRCAVERECAELLLKIDGMAEQSDD